MEARAPDSFPIGVRAPATINEPGMGAGYLPGPAACLPAGSFVPMDGMDRIRAAIESGASGDELAALPIPDHYRAAYVRREDVDMFAEIESAEKDPAKSLHIGDVATPELAPDEAYVAVMASSINFNTVWTSIFEPLPTFVFLDRYARESTWAARHALPYHVVGSDASGVDPAGRVGGAQLAPRRPSDGPLQLASTTRIPRPTTTRCSPSTSGSGASRRTSVGSPTWPSSRRTS